MAKINTKILRIETSVARPVELQIFRGENVPIELHFANYGQAIDLTGYTAEAYYQSPDMTSSWYKDEAEGHLVIDESGEFVTWFWTPEIDAGADKYKWFVRVYKDEEDDSYRAFGGIEMLGSPASTPVEPFPPPPIEIDCSKYEWLNYPWLDDASGSVRGYNLVNGTVTPDKLSEKYLRDTGPDQYSNQVDYIIQSTFNGSSYFDVNPVWHIPVEGVTHTVELLGINPYDWYGYARYRDGDGSSTWQGYATGCSVYLSVDGGEEREIGNLNATIARESDGFGGIVLNVYDGQVYSTSQFAISMRLEVNTVDEYLVTNGAAGNIRSGDPSLLGFSCNHGESVDAAIAADEIYWGGNLAPDSYVDRKIAEAEPPDGSITSAKLANGAVTSTKLGDFSVTTNKIAVGSVTPDRLNRAYVMDFGTSTSDTLGDDDKHLTPMLRNGYWGLSRPDSGHFDVVIGAENGHDFDFYFSSFPMPDVVKMINAGTDGTFAGLEPLNLECEVQVEDTVTGDAVHAYPVLDWTFDIDNNGDLTAEGVGYFDEDIPMHMWVDFEKEGNVVKCYHVYIVAGDSQHTILGTYVDNDTDGNLGTFVTETPASLGRLVTELDLQANHTEQVNADWNATSGAEEILNKPNIIPVTIDSYQGVYKTTTDVQQLVVANSDQSKFAYLFAPQGASDTRPAYIGTNGTVQAAKLQTSSGISPNPLTIPAGADANDAVARTSDLPAFETWTFELSDSTTVTKKVCVYN